MWLCESSELVCFDLEIARTCYHKSLAISMLVLHRSLSLCSRCCSFVLGCSLLVFWIDLCIYDTPPLQFGFRLLVQQQTAAAHDHNEKTFPPAHSLRPLSSLPL